MMHQKIIRKIPLSKFKYDRLLQLSRQSSSSSKMSGWQIHQYGGFEELTLNDSIRMASIKNPNDLVVKIHASSINPIDMRMMGGYGRTVLNKLRKRQGFITTGTEFPLTLGRDFSGTVVETGQTVTGFKPGDEVWGVSDAIRPGSLAQYVAVSNDEISKKPGNLSHQEAASIPYVCCTTWMALCTLGKLKEDQAVGKRLLILAGSGGIGTFAIQLASGWGVDVTVTCGPDSVDLVKSLGASTTVNYRSPQAWQELKSLPKFDMVLDCLGGENTEKAVSLLAPWKNSKVLTLVNPFMRNADNLGLLLGIGKSLLDAGAHTLKGLASGGGVRWVVFRPNSSALDRVRQMVEANQIRPIVHEIFPFDKVPQAFEMLKEGHLRGKIVIDTVGSS